MLKILFLSHRSSGRILREEKPHWELDYPPSQRSCPSLIFQPTSFELCEQVEELVADTSERRRICFLHLLITCHLSSEREYGVIAFTHKGRQEGRFYFTNSLSLVCNRSSTFPMGNIFMNLRI